MKVNKAIKNPVQAKQGMPLVQTCLQHCFPQTKRSLGPEALETPAGATRRDSHPCLATECRRPHAGTMHLLHSRIWKGQKTEGHFGGPLHLEHGALGSGARAMVPCRPIARVPIGSLAPQADSGLPPPPYLTATPRFPALPQQRSSIDSGVPRTDGGRARGCGGVRHGGVRHRGPVGLLACRRQLCRLDIIRPPTRSVPAARPRAGFGHELERMDAGADGGLAEGQALEALGLVLERPGVLADGYAAEFRALERFSHVGERTAALPDGDKADGRRLRRGGHVLEEVSKVPDGFQAVGFRLDPVRHPGKGQVVVLHSHPAQCPRPSARRTRAAASRRTATRPGDRDRPTSRPGAHAPAPRHPR